MSTQKKRKKRIIATKPMANEIKRSIGQKNIRYIAFGYTIKTTEAKKVKPQERGKAGAVAMENSEIFTLREKRIGIIFKIIYVIAIFFSATVVIMEREMCNGLTQKYYFFACLSALFLLLLYTMISYIVSEMKCLKISKSELSSEYIDSAERAYGRIINCFYGSGISVTLCFVYGLLFIEKLTAGVAKILFSISLIPFTILFFLFWIFHHDKKKVENIFIGFFIATSISLILIFCILPLNMAELSMA